jgi:hypothetical protein
MTPLGPRTKTTSESRTKGKQEAPQTLAKQLETWQELTQNNSRQSSTHPNIFPNQNPIEGRTSQTGGEH